MTRGFADGYLYQCTPTSTAGFPLVGPNNEQADMHTTQHDRNIITGGDFESVWLHNTILHKYIQNLQDARSDAVLQYKPYMYDRPKWHTYRLSDAYGGRHRPLRTRQYHLRWYYYSLAGQYFRRTRKFNQFSVLVDVVRSNLPELKTRVPPRTVVIHLRMGDVIEFCGYTVDQHLEKELPYTKHPRKTVWVHSKAYYAEKLNALPSSVDQVLLVYGKHRAGKEYGNNFERTNEYVRKLRGFLEQKGYRTKTHSSSDPDQDFLLLCSAPYLIAGTDGGGGSGFANLAVQVNQALHRTTQSHRV